MSNESNYQSAKEFLAKMDAGNLDDNLIEEVEKLTDEQRFELVRLMTERDGKSGHSAL